jgi:hypothetical protein
MHLRTIHATSAIVIGLFAVIHMANHLVALGGIAQHLAFMAAARAVYRIRPIEAVLLACVLVQVFSGMWLIIRGWRQRHGAVALLQAAAGAYLAFFLLIHVSAVLYGRVSFGLDTNFYFAAAGFHVRPFQLFFIPYYLIGVLALFTHVGCGACQRARSRGRSTSPVLIALAVAMGAAISVLIVLALAGVFYRVDIPTQYQAPYAQSAQH